MFEPSEHLWRVQCLILNVISPLLPSCWGFSFALGHGVSFFGGIQHSPVGGCSAASCNFGVLAGEDEHMSYSATLITWLSLRSQYGATSHFPITPPCPFAHLGKPCTNCIPPLLLSHLVPGLGFLQRNATCPSSSQGPCCSPAPPHCPGSFQGRPLPSGPAHLTPPVQAPPQ